MSTDGQHTKWRRNTAENFSRLSRVHERYSDRQTDGFTTTYERELTFTFTNITLFWWLTVAVKLQWLLEHYWSLN